jgi:hypothetical protein
MSHVRFLQCISAEGSVVVADSLNHCLRVIDPQMLTLSTLAGSVSGEWGYAIHCTQTRTHTHTHAHTRTHIYTYKVQWGYVLSHAHARAYSYSNSHEQRFKNSIHTLIQKKKHPYILFKQCRRRWRRRMPHESAMWYVSSQ